MGSKLGVFTYGPQTAMFTEGRLALPASGAELLRSSHDVDFLSGAAELFADAIDLKVFRRLADSYHSSHVTFQMARSEGRDANAIKLAHTELASVVSGIPDTTWSGIAKEVLAIARRTTIHARSAQEAMRAREVLGVGENSWRPEIVVRAKSPRYRAVGRAAVRRVFQRLIPLSINAGKTYPDWFSRVFSSGLLAAPRVEFSFVSFSELQLPITLDMPEDEKVVLSVRHLSTEDGVPHFEIAYDDERILDERYLTYALLRTSINERRYNIRRRNFDAGIKAVRHIEKGSSLEPAYMRAAMPVQAALLRGEGNEEVREALKAIGTPEQSRIAIIDRLRAYWIRFTIDQAPPEKEDISVRANIDCGLPRVDVMKGDLRKALPLKINLNLTRELMGRLSTGDVWMLLTRALGVWMLKDRLSEMRDVDLTALSLKRYGVTFNGKDEYVSLSPRTDESWAQEFSHLVKWSGNFVTGVSREDFPGLAELLPSLLAYKSSNVREIMGPLRVNVVDVPGGTARIRMMLYSDEPRTADARVGLNFGGLSDTVTPLKMIELLLRARSAVIRGTYSPKGEISRKGLHFWQVEWLMEADAAWNNAWTWIRLMLDYEKLVASEKTNAGLNITGDGAKEVAAKLVPAIRAVQVANGSLFTKSMKAHDNWIVETSAVMVKTALKPDGGVTNPKRKPASRMTVLTAERARLIHFDGEPIFDAEDWKRLAEVILSAPAGFTWVKPTGMWDSNRPELIVRAGEESWFAMNPVYSGAIQPKRLKYQNALRFVRAMIARHAGRIDLPLPEPQSSREDIQTLRGRMLGLFHTDTAERSDHVVIGQDDLQKLIESFQTLLRFHK